MHLLKAWIEAMRLRTLPVSIAGVVAAVGFNVQDGSFKAVPAFLCLVFAILCQIASNFANEYFDFKAGRDAIGREGPRRGVTEGDISPKAMQTAIILTLCVAAVVGLSLTFWGGLWLIGVGILVGLGALAYSTGPFPLSTHCMGEIAVILFFGIVPVNLTYYVQALAWSQPVLLTSIAIGLMGANVLVVNNTRDIPDDKAVGKHTLATVFGVKMMAVLYSLNAFIAVGLTISVWLLFSHLYLFVPLIYLVLSVFISIRLSQLHGRELTPLLAATSMLMLAYSVLLFIGLAFA